MTHPAYALPPEPARSAAVAARPEAAPPVARAAARRRATPSGGLRGAFVRFIAPIVWRSRGRIAAKLLEFGATEAGSATEMLRAAELARDPALRKLFFRHAVDEAIHARLFRDVAREVQPGARQSARAEEHERRRDLYEALGPARFLAFVHLAEKRGEAHFLGLVAALARTRPDLAATFARVARDERFHVSYSARQLAKHAEQPHRVLARAQLDAAWGAYRRAGRRIGEALATAMFHVLYFAAIAPFAWAERRRPPEPSGWHRVPAKQTDPRRQAR